MSDWVIRSLIGPWIATVQAAQRRCYGSLMDSLCDMPKLTEGRLRRMFRSLDLSGFGRRLRRTLRSPGIGGMDPPGKSYGKYQ